MRTLVRGMALLLGGTVLAGCIATSTHSGGSSKPAPEIRGIDADGKSFQLSDYRGKVVLLDFWAAY